MKVLPDIREFNVTGVATEQASESTGLVPIYTAKSLVEVEHSRELVWLRVSKYPYLARSGPRTY